MEDGILEITEMQQLPDGALLKMSSNTGELNFLQDILIAVIILKMIMVMLFLFQYGKQPKISSKEILNSIAEDSLKIYHIMKLLENIHGTEASLQIFKWLQSISDFEQHLKSSYSKDRLEVWYGLGSNLQSIVDKRGAVTQYSAPPEFVAEIGNKYLPKWNSILVCKGNSPDSNTSIHWHRDHGHFFGPAVMVNFGKAEYSQRHYEHGIQSMDLTNGDIIEINTKLIHQAKQISKLRYNITFREVRPEYAI